MAGEDLAQLTEILGMPIWLFTVIILWSLVWKGFALWKSARKNSKVWFIFLLILNTVGILPILYIFVFSEMNKKPTKKTKKKK